jgi:hypothetical protein
MALVGLQEERSACVRRLEAMLAAQGPRTDVEAYLARIQNINAALVRLAGARLVH